MAAILAGGGHMPEHNSEGEQILSVGTISTLAQRFAIQTLKSSGHRDIAEWLTKWPEILGIKTGKAIKNILDKRAHGQQVSVQDERALQSALDENPKEAATLLGLLTADLLEGAIDAATKRRTILKTYGSVLGIVSTFMASNTTSIVLKGFIHREDCISYWHFERSNLEFSASGDDYLYPNGLQVYFIDALPDDALLKKLNWNIRDDPERHLPAEFYDFEHDSKIAKLEAIYETKVSFKQLDPNSSPTEEPKKDDPFGFNAIASWDTDYEYSQRIPSDLRGLKGLIDSLFLAKDALGERDENARRVSRDIANREKAS
jgi:hypothetical protein